jgi:primosomal protein N'
MKRRGKWVRSCEECGRSFIIHDREIKLVCERCKNLEKIELAEPKPLPDGLDRMIC